MKPAFVPTVTNKLFRNNALVADSNTRNVHSSAQGLSSVAASAPLQVDSSRSAGAAALAVAAENAGAESRTTTQRSRTQERVHRVAAQPAFILHSYPYKETSLIVDVFSREFGRVALMAKGAKRPHSKLRGALQTFQPLSVSWSGKSEVRTLTNAEWVGGMLPLEKSALLCGFYLNELLVKLLARDDPHPALFDHYVSALNQLVHDEPAPIVLRKFERRLMLETGVGGDLTICSSTGTRVLPSKFYVVDPERGPRPAVASDTWPHVAGATLIDMQNENYADAGTQSQSKQLMRFLLAHHLAGAQLNTRQILLDLMQL